MIVKDEAPVIRRCLDSVRTFVDRWVIVDTGSRDGTQQIVREHFRDLPGELHERPWRNFGANRSEALELARPLADYSLVMDADNIFCAPAGWQVPKLEADAYTVTHLSSGVSYAVCSLVANRLPWRYEGVVHEYPTCDGPHRLAHLDGPVIDRRHEGSRSRDPDTFRKDAALLEAELARNPQHARYAFYLAQSWRDAGEPERALAAYRHRAGMAGFDEETWYALFEVARLSERLSRPQAEVAQAYLTAFQARPQRAEPLVELARYHRVRGEHALACLYARSAAALPQPADRLFVDTATYAWRALDELATSAWYAGARDEGRRAAERLLAERRFPEAERSRIESNAAFYEDR